MRLVPANGARSVGGKPAAPPLHQKVSGENAWPPHIPDFRGQQCRVERVRCGFLPPTRLVRMVNHALRLAHDERHVQRLDHGLRRLLLAEHPTHRFAAVDIEHDRQIDKSAQVGMSC